MPEALSGSRIMTILRISFGSSLEFGLLSRTIGEVRARLANSELKKLLPWGECGILELLDEG